MEELNSNLQNEVAKIIEEHKDTLSSDWINCVKLQIPASKGKTRIMVLNHLDDFFVNLVTALRKNNQKREDQINVFLSEEHGKQRAKYEDYSIRQVIEEYHILRTTIFDFLDDKCIVRKRERNIINEFIDDFIRISSATFSDELSEKLREALKVRDEFITNISHELKTPLTSMKLQTQISRKNIVRQAKEHTPSRGVISFIDQNEKGINRLNHLVEDMIDITKINLGELKLENEDFILTEAIEEVLLQMSEYLADFHCVVKTQIPSDIHLHCDKFRFEQILYNLISNAAKYGAGGDIELFAHVHGKEIIIAVQDHGRGIEQKDQERIFNRYVSVSSNDERKGLGLGLFIVKNLTKMLGGDIELESRPGHGSNFIVHLPLQ